MINQDKDLNNSDFISQHQAKRAIQECMDLKNENQKLRNQLEEEKAKNNILKASKRQLEVLKTQNQEMEKTLEEFLETLRAHGQYTFKVPEYV